MTPNHRKVLALLDERLPQRERWEVDVERGRVVLDYDVNTTLLCLNVRTGMCRWDGLAHTFPGRDCTLAEAEGEDGKLDTEKLPKFFTVGDDLSVAEGNEYIRTWKPSAFTRKPGFSGRGKWERLVEDLVAKVEPYMENP